MLLTQEQIIKNHGECMAMIYHALDSGYLPAYMIEESNKLLDQMNAHHKAIKEELADASVSQDDYRGDHCGYLAAQCKARTLRGLKPTDEQVEAWIHDNTNAVQTFKGEI